MIWLQNYRQPHWHFFKNDINSTCIATLLHICMCTVRTAHSKWHGTHARHSAFSGIVPKISSKWWISPTNGRYFREFPQSNLTTSNFDVIGARRAPTDSFFSLVPQWYMPFGGYCCLLFCLTCFVLRELGLAWGL